MVRGWFTLRVELESGMGLNLVPRPGRIFLVGPKHTLLDLATAIDLAFARWDLSHLNEFEFRDGRRYGIPDDNCSLPATDYERARVGAVVRKEEPFTYLFDLSDCWKHTCRVMESNVDPLEAAGIVPRNPIPIWGWGWIPDQYCRHLEMERAEDGAL